jgi:hypothetical protein
VSFLTRGDWPEKDALQISTDGYGIEIDLFSPLVGSSRICVAFII